MRLGRTISRCGCYGTNAIRHIDLRRQASSRALGLSEARKQQRDNESWAKQSGAREVLVQPPFEVEREEEGVSAEAAGMLDSLEGYLQVGPNAHTTNFEMAVFCTVQSVWDAIKRTFGIRGRSLLERTLVHATCSTVDACLAGAQPSYSVKVYSSYISYEKKTLICRPQKGPVSSLNPDVHALLEVTNKANTLNNHDRCRSRSQSTAGKSIFFFASVVQRCFHHFLLTSPRYCCSGAGTLRCPPPFTSRFRFRLVLQARRWHHPEGPARRFLSHLLTYPLTLAAGLHEAGLDNGTSAAISTASTNRERPPPPSIADNRKKFDGNRTSSGGGDNSSSSRRLAVVCLGARAESSMPPTFWRETLFALPGVSHLVLHLIGPELSLPSGLTAGKQATASDGIGTTGRDRSPSTTTAAVSVGARTADIRWTRAMLGRTAGTRVGGGDGGAAEGSGVGKGSRPDSATVAAVDEAMATADAFVLFNPGLGHPHLREGWDGALKRLLATGKPIVVSCHSRKDLERDARLLREAGAVSCGCPGSVEEDGKGGGESDYVSPRENPFRSLMVSEDPLSAPGAEELVSCNWGVMIVKGADGENESR